MKDGKIITMSRILIPVMLCVFVPVLQAQAEEVSVFGSDGWVRLVQFAGKFHPVTVHIPIALVLAAGLAEVLACLTKNRFFQNAARFNIIIAALGGLASALVGLAAGAFAEYPENFLRSFSMHKWLGIGTAVFLVFAVVMSEIHHRAANTAFRLSYRIALALCVVLISLCGLFGGHLVYGLNHYSW